MQFKKIPTVHFGFFRLPVLGPFLPASVIYSITVRQGMYGGDVKLVRLDSRFLAVSPTVS